MKKQIISAFIILTMLVPMAAGAQAVAIQNQQLAALINQTIALIQQLITKLTVQLNELQATESADNNQIIAEEEETDATEEEIAEIPVITIKVEGLDFRFNDPESDGKYLVDLKLKSKKNFIKATLSYYTYISDDSMNQTQTSQIIRSIDIGEIIELNRVKYSIEMKDINNRQVNISEWFEIIEASGTASGEPITIGF